MMDSVINRVLNSFILGILWPVVGVAQSGGKAIVNSTEVSIRCASGEVFRVKKGTMIEMTDRRVGARVIVKLPSNLHVPCEFGLISKDAIDADKKNKRMAGHRATKTSMDVEGKSSGVSKGIAQSPSSTENRRVITKNTASFTQNSKVNGADKKQMEMRRSKKTASQKGSVVGKSQVSRERKRPSTPSQSQSSTGGAAVGGAGTPIRKLAEVASTMNYADRCQKEFVNEKGLGEWGQFVKSKLSESQFQNLLQNHRPFRNVCPGFQFMSKDERKNLWVFILMAMSHYESSCRPQVEAQGPYGIATGLLQLHQGAENQYVHWDRQGICKKGASKRPKESLQCTLSMLQGQVTRFDSVFFEKSYWDVLRNVNAPDTHASKIKRAIQMLPGCDNRNVASDEIKDKQEGRASDRTRKS